MTLIKSISGIRGTIGGPAGENLTPPDVVKFTTAYVRLIARRNPGKKLTIVVGRDARISGEMVSNLVEGTLLACGADVVNVGLCTTPGTEMAVIGKKADGGIIITASHNPRQWNALKLLNSDGEFLNDAEGKQVLAMSEEEDYDYPAIDAIGHVLSREDFNDEHIRRVLALPLVDVEAVRKRRFKVVVDAVNSVGGIVMPELLRRLDASTLILGPPGSGKTTLLRECVRSLSDGGSRVGLVDERGELAACRLGIPQMDVGAQTDVLTGCGKSEGIYLLLRAMNPQWIAVDEITAPEDIRAMEEASYCGVRFLATAHAFSPDELRRRPLYRRLRELELFQRLLILSPDKHVTMERMA